MFAFRGFESHPIRAVIYKVYDLSLPFKRALEDMLKHAKAKKTKVAAEITLEDGRTIYGCNLESACHTLSI